MANDTDPKKQALTTPETEISELGAYRMSPARERLIENPNLNQAGNDAGSEDNTTGSQTGNDIDLIPEK